MPFSLVMSPHTRKGGLQPAISPQPLTSVTPIGYRTQLPTTRDFILLLYRSLRMLHYIKIRVSVESAVFASATFFD